MKKIAAASAVLALGACSSIPEMPKMPAFSLPSFKSAPADAASATPVIPETPADAAPREHVARAIALLDAGKADEARVSLKAALAKAPKDATALSLMEQIESDPVKLLGEASETYVVAAGDTMSGLADRYLDDPLLFFALARYNGLAAPNALTVGRALKIPVRPSKEIAPVVEVAAPPAPAAPLSVNAEKANAIRLQALELLNSGDVSKAVALLGEAQSLDGANPAIRKDLERARRIQSALTNG
jgi:Tfp pilus assembly protein PilF